MNGFGPRVAAPGASPEEAAAIICALVQLMGEATPEWTGPAGPARPSPWKVAALAEGVERWSPEE